MGLEERFTNRSEYYARYRPWYPEEVLALLRAELGLNAGWTVADLGSGTGIFSRLLLSHVATVFGVEPNAEMRAAAERELADEAGFISVDGSAEATGLAPLSVDLVCAATAFHWFRPAETKKEVRRILKRSGWALLVWNTRAVERSQFQRGFEDLLVRHCPLYEPGWKWKHQQSENPIAEFFGASGVSERTIPHGQEFDWEGLQGRLLSASYAPLPGSAEHETVIAALRLLFDQHAVNGQVRFEYDCNLYWGRLDGGPRS